MASKRDLIDLAIEYEMIKSTSDFYNRTEKAQTKILQTIQKIADTLDLSDPRLDYQDPNVGWN